MPTTYTLSEHDYVACAQLCNEHGKTTRRVHFAIDVLLVIAGLVSLLRGDQRLGLILLSTAIGAIVLPWIIKHLIAPLILKRHYYTYKKIQEPISVELTDDGLCFTIDTGHSMLKWANIHSWRESPDYLLIFLAPKVFHSLPARIEKEGFPLSKLKEALHIRVGAAV